MAAKKKMPPELLERFKAKNEKKQGKNDRDDESIAARRGRKSQSLKDRRDESKAAEKKAGRRPYSKVDKTKKEAPQKKKLNNPGGGTKSGTGDKTKKTLGLAKKIATLRKKQGGKLTPTQKKKFAKPIGKAIKAVKKKQGGKLTPAQKRMMRTGRKSATATARRKK